MNHHRYTCFTQIYYLTLSHRVNWQLLNITANIIIACGQVKLAHNDDVPSEHR